jgi:P pilus assembly chaperone PapD
MNKKHLVLATSMMVLVATSGQAYAGTTISDTRYWPSEASSAESIPAQRAENAFALVAAPQANQAGDWSYHGGPKAGD